MKDEPDKKYYGSWSTNNGNTYNAEPWEFNNIRNLRKSLRAACNGNLTGPTDKGWWGISDIDGNQIITGVCRW